MKACVIGAHNGKENVVLVDIRDGRQGIVDETGFSGATTRPCEGAINRVAKITQAQGAKQLMTGHVIAKNAKYNSSRLKHSPWAWFLLNPSAINTRIIVNTQGRVFVQGCSPQ